MMTDRKFVALLVAAMAVAPVISSAQGGVAQSRAAQVPPQRGGGAEQRIGQLLREQLQLTDAQLARFQETTRKFTPRRTALLQEERQVRESMRDVLCSDDRSRGTEVSRWIDQMLDLEKRRIELRIEEQREMAGYLTPYQRARFIGALEVVQRRFDGEPGVGGRGGPPGGGRGAGRQGGPPGAGRGGPPGAGRGGPPPLDACGNPMRGGRGS